MIIFSEASVQDYKVLMGSLFIFVLLLFILPLLVFVPLLASVKRKYFIAYSTQAWPFARKYEEELINFHRTEATKPDSSWHVDMADSFAKTANMKIVLIDKTLMGAFIFAVVLPFIAVVAQEIPLKDIIVTLISKFMG